MIRIAIIEPSPVLGLGLRTLFERHVPEFRIDGIYRDIPSFREQCPKGMDIILLNTSVFGYTHHFNIREQFSDYEDALLIALTTELLRPDATASFDGMLHLYDEGADIVRQLKTIVEDSAGVNDGEDDGISEREKEIIIAVAIGQGNKEIADSLHLSVHTVMSHRKRISSKLGLKGTAGFTVYAMIHGLVGAK